MKVALKCMAAIFTIFILSNLCPLGHAAAPDWIKKDVSVNYTSGSEVISFTVLGKTSTDVQTQVYYKSTGRKNIATENASGDSGMFWFDPALLVNAYDGTSIGDYTVKSSSTQTIAGKSWETITLEATLSGVKTTRIYEKATGLLLKQTVDVSGASAVIFSNMYTPTSQSTSTSTQTQTQHGSQGTSGNGTSSTTGSSQSTAQQSSTQQPSGQSNSSSSTDNSSEGTGSGNDAAMQGSAVAQPDASSGTENSDPLEQCCPSTAILLLLSSIVVVKANG